MLNMLIGILCEVVTATGEGERAKSTEVSVREAIVDLFQSIDSDESGNIDKDEFFKNVEENKRVMKALRQLEIKPKHFEMYAKLLFKEEEDGAKEDSGAKATFDFEKTVNLIMRLRPNSKVSALDFASFQMTVTRNHDNLKKNITSIEKLTSSLTGEENPMDQKSPAASRMSVRQGSKQTIRQRSKIAEPVEDPPMKITATTIPTLEKTSDQEILAELTRRLGRNGQMGSAGGANSTINPSKVVEAFETFNVPQPLFDTTEAWSKETYTC